MIVDPEEYAVAVRGEVVEYRHVIALSLNSADTDIVYLTSHNDCLDPGGVDPVDRFDGVIAAMSGLSESVDPIDARHTIGNFTFQVLDVDGAFSARIKAALDAGHGLRDKRVIVYKGVASASSWAAGYTRRVTYLVSDVKSKDGLYTIATTDIKRMAKDQIFQPHQGKLSADIAADTMQIPLLVAEPETRFPLVYHDDKWDDRPGMAVGYVRIDDEIICHIGWTDSNYTHLQVAPGGRGALGTVEAAHTNPTGTSSTEQNKKVDEYIYIRLNAVKLVYALLTGLDISAVNLIGDVAGFGDFTATGGAGVLVESAEVGPVPWVKWFDVIDDAATYELINYTHGDFVVNQVYTASIAIKDDPSKTKTIYLRLTFLGLVGSYAEIRLTMSTGIISAGGVGDAVHVASVGVRQNGYWLLRVSAGCTNAAATGVQYNLLPAVSPAGATETQSIKAALPFMADRACSGMFPLPDHWHLGIHSDYVRAADFVGIGADLWDVAANDGRPARFMGEQAVDGKEFIERQLLQWLPAFMPVYSDGALGLRRVQNVLPYSSYRVLVDDDQITQYGELQYDQGAVINKIRIAWNYLQDQDRFTKVNELVDAVSVARYGLANEKEYEFRGVFTGPHTDTDINNYFDQIRDRYAAPPLKLSLTLMPRWDCLEVGDVIRVKTAHIYDTNAGASLDRAMEVQGKRVDAKSGLVTLSLFGGVEAASHAPFETGFKMQDAFYTAAGTSLASVLTISAGVVTANGVLTGSGDHNQSVYYYDGDLEIAPGVVVTVTGNVQLRIKGHFQINGKIDLKGQGNAGAVSTGARLGQLGAGGICGAGYTYESLDVYHLGDFDHMVFLNMQPFIGQWDQIFSSINALSVSNPDGASLLGLPADLRGTGGASGNGVAYRSGFQYPLDTILAPGAAGGASGGGLVIISRGGAFGAAGLVDLSGLDGAAPVLCSPIPPQDFTVYAGAGQGGFPGAAAWLIDGDASTPAKARFTCLAGDTPIPTATYNLTSSSWLPGVGSFAVGRAFNEAGLWDFREGNVLIRYIPPALNGFVHFAADEARQVAGYENKPPEWNDILDSAGTKPADNATVNNVYRAASASPPVDPIPGDFWVQTDTGRVLTRGAADWEAAATQNLVSRSASASPPVDPIPGDFWVQTDTGRVLTRGAADWEAAATQNLVSRSASASPPVDPIPGDFWVQTDTGRVLTRGAADWEAAATHNLVTHSASAPASPGVGDMWHDTSTGVYAGWDGSAWEPVATEGADWDVNVAGRPADADLLNAFNVLSASATYTVGPDGDYTSITAALADVAKKRPTFGGSAYRVEIELATGFTIGEQIIIDALDLSWVTITSIDASVSVTLAQAGFTVVSPVVGGSPATYRPVFCVRNGGRSPDIQINLTTLSSVSNLVLLMAVGPGSMLYSTADLAIDCSASIAAWAVLAVDNADIALPGDLTTDSVDIVVEAVQGGRVEIGSLASDQTGTYQLRSIFGGRILMRGTSTLESGGITSAFIATDGSEITTGIVSITKTGESGPGNIAEASYGSRISIGSIAATVAAAGNDFDVFVGGSIVCGSFPGTPTANIALNTQTSSGIVIKP